MAQAITKKKVQKRQPTKRKLPSSSVKKKSATKLKKVNLPLTPTKTLQLTFKISAAKNRKPAKRVSSKVAVPIALIIGGLGGIVYALWLAFYQPPLLASPQIPAPPVVAQPTSIKKSMTPSTATHLQISDIGVDTSVVSVGKKSDGSMQVPSNANVVGQYKHAPTPGEVGPAVLVGHVDSMTGPAVFWRLHELQPGQLIKITRQDGTTATFRVDGVKDFSQDNFPSQEVYGNIDYPGLRLITCGGRFDPITLHYSNNTVVFATFITE